MAAKNAAAKAWSIAPSFDGLRYSVYPAGDKPAVTPTLVSSTINGAGTTLTDVYSISVSIGAGGNAGRTLAPSGAAATLAYSSGSGSTTLVYTISRAINAGELVSSGYAQPGNGIEGTAGGVDLATFSGVSVTNGSSVGSGGLGFATRPYFFQQDHSRLLASMAANDAEATGSAGNSWGSPIGFITLCAAAAASSGRGGNPVTGSYNDVPTWHIAVAGWAKEANSAGTGTSMMDVAKNEVLALVAGNPSGTLTSDQFQHAEDYVGGVAIAVDCCYSRFTSGERATVAAWLNNAVAYMENQNRVFWPGPYVPSGKEAVNNNYFQNQTLTWALVGLCSEGWNSSAATHRAHFEVIAANYVAFYNGGSQSVGYVGQQISEGKYYSQYFRNAMWGIRQYDAVMGSTFMAQLGVGGATPEKQLEMGLFHLLPRTALTFFDGSEPNSSLAVVGTNGSNYLATMAGMCSSSSTVARVAKTIFSRADWTADTNNFWARYDHAFHNFYWNNRPLSALPVSSLTQRRLALPSPGGARTFLRSSGGWDGATTTRAAVMFSSMLDFTNATQNAAGYSHANPDVPGFQLAQGADWIATDVENGGSAGIAHEGGATIGSAWGNYVGLASGGSNPPGTGWPVQLFNEDNIGASVPHYYKSINAQPAWSQCSTYRREYVWLDDLQVVVIFDRVVTAGANNKTWRLHTIALPSVASGVATWTAGATSCRVRDLYSTDGTAMAGADVTETDSGATINRLSQVGTSNDWRSLKVLDLNGRCSAATLSSGAGYLQADMTINGVARSVRFFDNASHVTVS